MRIVYGQFSCTLSINTGFMGTPLKRSSYAKEDELGLGH